MPWWRTPMFSSGRSAANGSPQIDRCGLPYIGASATSGRIARRSVSPRSRPLTYWLRRATGCVGSSRRISGSSVRAASRDSSASTRRYGDREPRRRLGQRRAARCATLARCESTASALREALGRASACRRCVNSGSGATCGQAARVEPLREARARAAATSGRSGGLRSTRPVGAGRPAARRGARRLRARGDRTTELEPQHLVPARDAEQPVEACPRSAGAARRAGGRCRRARRSSSSPSVTIGWRRK